MLDLLDSSVAQTLIDKALNRGAYFCDIFVEESSHLNLEIQNQAVENIATGLDFGIGIRLVFGTDVYYGYTNSKDKAELESVLDTLVSAKPSTANPQTSSQTQSFHLGRSDSNHFFQKHFVKHGLDSNVSLDEKVAFLRQANREIKNQNNLVIKAKSTLMQKRQQIQVFNSEGRQASDDRHYLRFTPVAFVQDGEKQDTGMESRGGLIGWELMEDLDVKAISEEVVRRALTSLHAESCPAGKMPVVIANGFGGVIFHEACGHLLETTSVEKKASVFHDQMGKMIANPLVSAIDDGSITNGWGSIAIDDEGMPTQKTKLINQGRLENFLVDYVGHLKTGYALSGSARRQSYKYPPASRMRNTYIEAGPHSTEEMISSIDNGLYAKVMGGGSVQPGTGEFNFAALESYLIKGGKIDKPVRGATLIGTGPDILQKIVMVGEDLDLATGMCGSVSGYIPVTVGQPSLKVDSILVGGDG